MMKLRQFLVVGSAMFAFALTAPRPPANTIVIQADKLVAEVQPTMWGVFFEDINLGADGGIYAELVKNRSFEFNKPMMGWTVQRKKLVEGEVMVQNRQEKATANPRYISININNAAKGNLGL